MTWKRTRERNKCIASLKREGYTILPPRREGEYAHRPQGIGYLERMLDDDGKPHAVRFSPVQKFERMLAEKGIRRYTGPDALTRARAKEYAERALTEPMAFEPGRHYIPLTVQALKVVYGLAIAAGVTPASIFALLVYYGIEKCAEEMRGKGTMPEPKIVPKAPPSTFIGA